MEEDSRRGCVNCGAVLKAGADTCPQCGQEQPVRWMVILAYGLLALFVLGVIYRLIWP
jgi:predicted nucleic acid-binding Zn ribbon protein